MCLLWLYFSSCYIACEPYKLSLLGLALAWYVCALAASLNFTHWTGKSWLHAAEYLYL